jgi:K+-sensing histidine kinase KdpD
MDTAIIKSGITITGDIKPTDINALLNDISNSIISLCLDSKHVFALTNDIPIGEYYMDPNWIKSVIINLLENARKHSPEETIISLIARLSEATLQFVVEDEGPGMSPEIIDAFYKGIEIPHVQGQRQRMKLGLKIIKYIVDQFKWNISFTNRPQGGLRAVLSTKAEPRR